MANALFDPTDDRFICDLIRRKANQLIGNAGFTYQDRKDLEQDLWIGVLQSLSKFDPKVAHRNKFFTATVARDVTDILRNKRAVKRDHRQVCSLNVMIDIADEGATESAQMISYRELDARLGRDRRDGVEIKQLAIDLADVIATLPAPWQTLLELLKTHTMTDAARKMGVPRTTLNYWMRCIRSRFEDAGLRDYL